MPIAMWKLLLINTGPNINKNKAGDICTLNTKLLNTVWFRFEDLRNPHLIRANSQKHLTQQCVCLEIYSSCVWSSNWNFITSQITVTSTKNQMKLDMKKITTSRKEVIKHNRIQTSQDITRRLLVRGVLVTHIHMHGIWYLIKVFWSSTKVTVASVCFLYHW